MELSPPIAGGALHALSGMAGRVSVNKIKKAVFLVCMLYLFMVWFHSSSRSRRVKVTGCAEDLPSEIGSICELSQTESFE